MASPQPAAGGEREPLVSSRSTTTLYTDDQDVAQEGSKDAHVAHYNLAGLSPTDFWVLCFSLWTCAFLAAFDATVVATLIGPISSYFLASNLASWLGTSYLLSVCCFTPIYGRLCNILGRQVSMLIALGFFSLGNILCAVAPSMELLIAARALAGVGGGGLALVGSTIMSDLVPITHRGIFQGYANIMFGFGMGLGAPVGGFVNDTLGWRWAFYLQIPFLALSGTLIFFKVRYTVKSGTSTPTASQTPRQMFARIDFLGSFTLAGFVGAALVAISFKTNSTVVDAYKWTSPLILGLLGASAVLFLAFCLVETRYAAEPVLPFGLLRQRTPVSVAINNMVISILIFSILYTVPLYYLTVRLMSPSKAGTYLIANSFCSAGASLASGFYVRHTGRYYWFNTALGVLSVVGTVLLATWDVNTSEWMLWTNFPLISLAMGGITTLTIVALVADIGRDHVAVATSLSYVFRSTGQVLGVALSGALLQSILQKELEKRITGDNASQIITSIRQSSSSIRYLPPVIREAAVESYLRAIRGVFIVSIVFAVVGLLAGMGMRNLDLHDSPKESAPASDDGGEA
ncbi:hypothetical protein P7C73_g4525, partial [Tremellales sp. Uapishka_1]